MTRRELFATVAALFAGRKLLPPHADCGPLSVESLREALDEYSKMADQRYSTRVTLAPYLTDPDAWFLDEDAPRAFARANQADPRT